MESSADIEDEEEARAAEVGVHTYHFCNLSNKGRQ